LLILSVCIVIILLTLLIGIGKRGFRRKLTSAPIALERQTERTQEILQTLYQHVHAGEVSFEERQRLGREEDAYIYGEIEFASFYSLLKSIDPKPGEVFYDLGCGSGRAILAATLHFDLSKVCGIEYLPGLCALANEQLKKAIALVQATHDEWTDTFLQRLSRVQVIQDNFLNDDFSDGDIFLIAATCFNYSTWEALVEKLVSVKPGSRIMVATKKIKHPQFTLIAERFELMSWGMNSVQVYLKTR